MHAVTPTHNSSIYDILWVHILSLKLSNIPGSLHNPGHMSIDVLVIGRQPECCVSHDHPLRTLFIALITERKHVLTRDRQKISASLFSQDELLNVKANEKLDVVSPA